MYFLFYSTGVFVSQVIFPSLQTNVVNANASMSQSLRKSGQGVLRTQLPPSLIPAPLNPLNLYPVECSLFFYSTGAFISQVILPRKLSDIIQFTPEVSQSLHKSGHPSEYLF